MKHAIMIAAVCASLAIASRAEALRDPAVYGKCWAQCDYFADTGECGGTGTESACNYYCGLGPFTPVQGPPGWDTCWAKYANWVYCVEAQINQPGPACGPGETWPYFNGACNQFADWIACYQQG